MMPGICLHGGAFHVATEPDDIAIQDFFHGHSDN